MSEMVSDFKVENYPFCVCLFPRGILTPADAQMISLCNHPPKLRRFLKTIKRDCSKRTLRKPKPACLPTIRAFQIKQVAMHSEGSGGLRCCQFCRPQLSALPPPCVVSPSTLCCYNRIGKDWVIYNQQKCIN